LYGYEEDVAIAGYDPKIHRKSCVAYGTNNDSLTTEILLGWRGCCEKVCVTKLKRLGNREISPFEYRIISTTSVRTLWHCPVVRWLFSSLQVDDERDTTRSTPKRLNDPDYDSPNGKSGAIPVLVRVFQLAGTS
jgi:hypothetical protein